MHLLETILCSGQILTMLALASKVNREPSQSMPNLIDLASLAFAPIKDRMQNLMCIVKEYLLSIEPQLVAAIPPPAKNTIAM